jgi:hypothetical protein
MILGEEGINNDTLFPLFDDGVPFSSLLSCYSDAYPNRDVMGIMPAAVQDMVPGKPSL